MEWKNTSNQFGAMTRLFHWSMATAFIVCCLLAYYIIWFILPYGGKKDPMFMPLINLHWVLGIFVGVLVIPRLIWRIRNPQPPGIHITHLRIEHWMVHAAHWALYALMIIMPITGYIGTGRDTDFYLFTVPNFRDTAFFTWLCSVFGFTWQTFEPPVDVIHHFLGKTLVPLIVVLHIAAAFFHHYVNRDAVLNRMLGKPAPAADSASQH